MSIKETQITVGRLLGLGVPLTSLFLITSGVSDPVNVTKMTAAGGLGIAGLVLFLVFGLKESLLKFPLILTAVALLVLTSISALLFSKAPFAQSFYGTYGRNTGFATYLFMVGVMLAALMLDSKKSFLYLIYGLLFTGIINVFYCAWVLAFGDFLSWSNPYGNILGLFGNPNFISAFLGMFITASIALIFSKELKTWVRLILVLLSVVALLEIVQSHAIQGLVVTTTGIIIVGFYFIYSKSSGLMLPAFYIGISTIVGFIAILGTLQRGPFSFVYKRSVSLRGSYWRAGIDMGMENPLHGVGFDSYGDWYRRSRPPIALQDMPGVHIMSNVSHNVVIDFFASGGWPLLVSYALILMLGVRSIVRATFKHRQYDPVFVSLAATWICYQLQSIISINQVGLTVWGWAFTGAIISYEKFLERRLGEERQSASKSRSRDPRNFTRSAISPALVASIGAGLGLFLAAPALNAEITWQSAIQSRNLEVVKKALVPTFMNPASSIKFAQAVELFKNNNFLDLAHQYALEATTYNSDYFDGWMQLYYLPNATSAEKNEAFTNMTRLDPLNPDVTQIR